MKFVSVLFCLLVASSEAFLTPSSHKIRSVEALTVPASFPPPTALKMSQGENNQPQKVAALTSLFWTATSQLALADSPDWGLFEGRIGSLLHPTMMIGLLLFSLSTAWLGFDWRRQRTIGDDINSLKKQLPDLQGADSLSAAMAAAKESGDTQRVAALQAGQTVQAELETLQAERKALAEKGPRDRHFSQGSLLAFLGIAFAIEVRFLFSLFVCTRLYIPYQSDSRNTHSHTYTQMQGPLNTYARAGKLFPGPHLYVGATLVFLWALIVSTIPAMQKGNDLARGVHIGANVSVIALFAWQVQSGIPILLKVIEKTSWP